MRSDSEKAGGVVPDIAHAEHWAKSAFKELGSLVAELPRRLGRIGPSRGGGAGPVQASDQM